MSNTINSSHNNCLEREYEAFCHQFQTTQMILNYLEYLKLQQMTPKHTSFVNRMIREQNEKYVIESHYLHQLEIQLRKPLIK